MDCNQCGKPMRKRGFTDTKAKSQKWECVACHIFRTGKSRGAPRKYQSNAERQKAYRDRIKQDK